MESWITEPIWLAISRQWTMNYDIADQVTTTLESHKAKCVIPRDLLAAIIEGRVCVCPDQRIKKDVDQLLYHRTGGTAVPCFVEVLPIQKSESKSGKVSNGKGTRGPSSPVRNQPPR